MMEKNNETRIGNYTVREVLERLRYPGFGVRVRVA